MNEDFKTIKTQILMYEPFPSISKVYALVLQNEPHKSIGHGGFFSAKPDSVAMYANSKSKNSGNSNWNKGNNKKERPLCTHCNMLGHTVDKCYKLHGYPPRYKPKGRSNANANQVSFNQATVTENYSIGSVQCPISKAQCEQLLAFFNTGNSSSDTHHIANVSTGNGAFGLNSGAFGVPVATGMHAIVGVIATSSQSLANTNFINTMSGTIQNLSFTPTLKRSIFSAKLVNRNSFGATN